MAAEDDVTLNEFSISHVKGSSSMVKIILMTLNSQRILEQKVELQVLCYVTSKYTTQLQ